MKVRSVDYIGSFGYEQPLPRSLGPEFVFIGRSNVGKSSLINALVGRKQIARTSNTPGRTRSANFYSINEELCFVDVPGYGYARVSKEERARWQKLIRSYLETRRALCGIVQLLDIRHTPNAADRETALAIGDLGKPLCLAFNKIDKIKPSQVDDRIRRHLGVLDVSEGTAVVPFSSTNGAGRRALWAWIEDVLSL